MAAANLQTIIVSKAVAKTRTKAEQLARPHARRIYTSRETENSWRFRQRPPTDFKKRSFRTFPLPGHRGITLVYGDLKASKRTKNPKGGKVQAGKQRHLQYVGKEGIEDINRDWDFWLEMQGKVAKARSMNMIQTLALSTRRRKIQSVTIKGLIMGSLADRARELGHLKTRPTTKNDEHFYNELVGDAPSQNPVKLKQIDRRQVDDLLIARYVSPPFKALAIIAPTTWILTIYLGDWKDEHQVFHAKAPVGKRMLPGDRLRKAEEKIAKLIEREGSKWRRDTLRVAANPKRKTKRKAAKKRNPAPPSLHRATARTVIGKGMEPKIKGSTVKEKVAEIKRRFRDVGISLRNTEVLTYDQYHKKTGKAPYSPIYVVSEGEIYDILLHGDERLDLIDRALSPAGLWYELTEWGMSVIPSDDRDQERWNAFLDAYRIQRSTNPKKKAKRKTKKKPVATARKKKATKKKRAKKGIAVPKAQKLRAPKVMPDPGPSAWCGSTLEFAIKPNGGPKPKWVKADEKGNWLWEGGLKREWLFLWSPEYKAVIAIPRPRGLKGGIGRKAASGKVVRDGGGAKMFERFASRASEQTQGIDIPECPLHKLGDAVHIVYRADKWSAARKTTDYIHDFKNGVQLYCGPSVSNPKVFLCFGGKLTMTERGLVF